MDCSRGGSKERAKNCVLQGVQRYKCKSCGYNYTVAFRRGTKPADQKRLALLLHLEGLGSRSIGRILNVYSTTVYRRIRGFGEQIDVIRNDKPVEILELDITLEHRTATGFGLVLVETTERTADSGQGRDRRTPVKVTLD